ncbi:hypothetical protein LP420_10070 [Massilia sp. B-10]|nr:hypothetical protein LP420_10070 [Massilia sp. B-10]
MKELAEQVQSDAGKSLADTSRLVATAEDLMRSRITAEAQWLDQHRERMDQLAGMLQTELGALRDQEAARGDAAVAHLSDLQSAVTTHLTTLGTALEEPITRLIETAAEAPRAAAEVIGQLRQEISHSVARDNAVLEERSRIMETLKSLLDVINHASHEQRAVIDSLVASSSGKLESRQHRVLREHCQRKLKQAVRDCGRCHQQRRRCGQPGGGLWRGGALLQCRE